MQSALTRYRVVAYIVGVPWQDIARDSHDLTKGFKNATELAAKDKAGHTTWDYIIGDPANYVAPLYTYPLHTSSDGMIEYRADAFGGALKGQILVANYSVGDDITRIKLAADGHDDGRLFGAHRGRQKR